MEAICHPRHRRHVTLLRQEVVQRLLIEIIHEKMEDPDEVWEQLRGYIHSHDNLSPASIEIRIYQLAERISRVFQQYEYLRWEMLEEWKKGNTCFSGAIEEIELWQRGLWMELYGEGARVGRSVVYSSPIFQSNSRSLTIPKMNLIQWLGIIYSVFLLLAFVVYVTYLWILWEVPYLS